MTTIVDTDALIGLSDPNDAHHEHALSLAQTLIAQKATIHMLPTTLAEFALVATTKLGLGPTQKAVALLRERYALLDVRSWTVDEALALFARQTSKENSLFDCFVMVTAKQLNADCIFSFDGGYTQNGFILIEDFLNAHTPS